MWVVLETGSHANWVYRLLKRLGHEPLMGDTHRLALITQSLSKDDRTGAERLAELGLRMPEMSNAVEPCSRFPAPPRPSQHPHGPLFDCGSSAVGPL